MFSLSVSRAPPCWPSLRCHPRWKDLISVRPVDRLTFTVTNTGSSQGIMLSLTSSSHISGFFPFFPPDSSSSSSSSSLWSSLSSSSSSSSSLSPSFLLHLFLTGGLTKVKLSSPRRPLSLFPVFLAWMPLSLWRQRWTVSLCSTFMLFRLL